MKTNREWELRVASYCMVGLGVLAAIGYIAWKNEVLGDVAAWVQAIGSIAAIWGAFVIGEKQALQAERTARRQQQIREREWILAVIEVIHQIENTMDKAIDHVEELSEKKKTLKTLELWLDMVDPLLRQLDAIPLHQPPYSRIASKLVRFRFSAKLFLQKLKTLAEEQTVPSWEHTQSLITWRNNALAPSNELRGILKLPNMALRTPPSRATSP